MSLHQTKKRIAIGDTVPVVIDGGLQELTVVGLPTQYQRRRWLTRRYPTSLTVKLPDGRCLACRYMPVAH